MKWVVYESGSRAGLSAEVFFRYYKKSNHNDDVLFLVDDDCNVNSLEVYPKDETIKRVSSCDVFFDENTRVFPADELSRQRKNEALNPFCLESCKVYKSYFDKKFVNEMLEIRLKGKRAGIKIPKTFDLSKVFIKPNKESAGSKGLMSLDDVCVSERINIKEEYVIDVLRNDKSLKMYPRQVVLKNGYDRFIKLLDINSHVCREARKFIEAVCPTNQGMFSGVFHLQLAKGDDDCFYFIEWSKRISGTSLVNVFRGMNPFLFLKGENLEYTPSKFNIGVWYRYEDFITSLDL